MYELWMVDSGTEVGTFQTESEALEAVRAEMEANGPSYADHLMLGLEGADGRSQVVAEGAALRRRALDEADRPPAG